MVRNMMSQEMRPVVRDDTYCSCCNGYNVSKDIVLTINRTIPIHVGLTLQKCVHIRKEGGTEEFGLW